ncbi:hypothetical protein [Nonomuraea dietziae]|uniref:hypothetical protein n=1 Tax=Nonomuraea dietziae TaxID=65515 RepID=UPI0031CF34DC
MITDIHTHHVPKGWPDLGWPGAPRLRIDSEREAMILVGDKEFRRVQDDCWGSRGAGQDDGRGQAGRLAHAGVLRLRPPRGGGGPRRPRLQRPQS